MTKEEKQKAIDALKKSAPFMGVTQEEFIDYKQTLNKVMDLLEQEACEDAVSRQAVLKAIKEWWRTVFNADGNPSLCDDILVLPPVTPQPRKGHWIYKEFDERTGMTNVHICSKCGYPLASPYKSFCSACGSDNREVEE